MDNPLALPPTPNTPDTIHDFNLSEVESMSDSDWLDISSRASEDNDSISLAESDREEVFQHPLSRRSISSHSSSRGDDVEAWEGLVEDTDAESLPSNAPALPAAAETGTTPVHDLATDRLFEEQRVKEALDQSMISTLSGSRGGSLSGSMHAPHSRFHQDLRLSFPDPLTSSRDELNRSYEDVSPVVGTHSESDLESPLQDIARGPLPEDPGRSSTPEVQLDMQQVGGFEVYLYGNSYADKWKFVETLLEKLALGAGKVLSPRDVQSSHSTLYWLNVEGNPHQLSLGHGVLVVDRTESSIELKSFEEICHDKSLAVIFLPSSFSVLPEHSLYLPVVAFPSLDIDPAGFSENLMRHTIQDKWKSMRIPSEKLLLLNPECPSEILNEGEVESLEPSEVANGFDPLLPQGKKCTKSFRMPASSASAVTILAILSLVLGYIISNSSVVPRQITPPTEEQYTVAVVQPTTTAINGSSDSSALPVVANVTMDLSLSSLKDFALGIVHRSPSSLSTSVALSSSGVSSMAAQQSATPSNTPAQHCHGRLPTNEKPSTEKSSDRPSTSSLSLTPPPHSKALSLLPSPSPDTTPLPATTGQPVYSLSTRFTASLIDIFNVKVFAEALNKELKELLDALDELLMVLSKHTASAWHISKATSEGLQGQFRRRNARAQKRARQLRENGERVISSLTTQAQGHMEHARTKAREIKDKLATRLNGEVIVYQKLEGIRARMRESRGRRAFKRDFRGILRKQKWA
ncbi:hypothetical protein EVG20_g4507 [Dentipellis fragilis]|uniref:Uncharacterized protein n=1 Tax=Dentipellis fragilis TaxID=205917 RepID=A0A4Y9YXV4_9AGAM|nr:hypothetical protein EVG20_g4507 [Dentipellis fragilis]